jgi:hypothetical protein
LYYYRKPPLYIVREELIVSEEILDKRNHSPSPLSVLGRYRDLCEIVFNLKRDLPAGMTLLEVIEGVREKTWAGLKEVMSKYAHTFPNNVKESYWWLMSRNLIQAAETLKWPLKIIYPNIPATQRRAFERGYQDLLYLQAEYVLSYLLIPLYPSSRLRVMGNSTNKIEERDYIQELMEIGR